ncbi:MAG: 30S ribosomal protein S20 [Deltaproteobacteria bacterium]
MATHKSALKRARQNKIRRFRNMNQKTKARNVVKDLRAALAESKTDQALERLSTTVSLLQQSASKGVIHKNKASRTISRLTRQVNRLTSEKEE